MPAGMKTLFTAAAYWSVMLLAACNSPNEAESRVLREEIARLQADSRALREQASRLKSEVTKLEVQKSIIEKLAAKGNPGVWELQWNVASAAFEPAIVVEYPAGEATAKAIVNGLNRAHSLPGLDYLAQRGATVYLRVKDPEHLTQRMGTTGAGVYLGSAVISLTSLPGVELVHFDFPEGDHAAPGYYSRAAFVSCC